MYADTLVVTRSCSNSKSSDRPCNYVRQRTLWSAGPYPWHALLSNLSLTLPLHGYQTLHTFTYSYIYSSARVQMARLPLLLASSLLSVATGHTPRPTGQSCLVTSFGAKGDNATEDTAAIQSAINATACSEIVVPAPGVYLVRPLFFSNRSDLTFTIENGATLTAWPDPYTYNATTGRVYPLLYSDDTLISNVTVGGGGVIDGQVRCP